MTSRSTYSGAPAGCCGDFRGLTVGVPDGRCGGWGACDLRDRRRGGGPTWSREEHPVSTSTPKQTAGDRRARDTPSVVLTGGRTEYLLNGTLHRVDGPAAIDADGTMAWWQHGRRHTASTGRPWSTRRHRLRVVPARPDARRRYVRTPRRPVTDGRQPHAGRGRPPAPRRRPEPVSRRDRPDRPTARRDPPSRRLTRTPPWSPGLPRFQGFTVPSRPDQRAVPGAGDCRLLRPLPTVDAERLLAGTTVRTDGGPPSQGRRTCPTTS